MIDARMLALDLLMFATYALLTVVIHCYAGRHAALGFFVGVLVVWAGWFGMAVAE